MSLSGSPKPCDDCNEPTEAQIQAQKLINKEWSLVEVTRDSEDFTSDFSGFTLKLSGTVNEGAENVQNGTFQTENGLAVFPPDGQWFFQSGSLSSQIVLAGRLTEYYLTNNDTNLRLIFQYDGETNVRTTGISGEYVFELEIN